MQKHTNIIRVTLIRNEFENKVRKFVDAQRSIAFWSVVGVPLLVFTMRGKSHKQLLPMSRLGP